MHHLPEGKAPYSVRSRIKRKYSIAGECKKPDDEGTSKDHDRKSGQPPRFHVSPTFISQPRTTTVDASSSVRSVRKRYPQDDTSSDDVVVDEDDILAIWSNTLSGNNGGNRNNHRHHNTRLVSRLGRRKGKGIRKKEDSTKNDYVIVLDEDDEDSVKEIEEALPEGCHVKTWKAGNSELNNKRNRGVTGKRIQGAILDQEQRSQLLIDLLVEERNGDTQSDGDRAFALQKQIDQEEEEQKVRLLNRNASDMAIAQALQIQMDQMDQQAIREEELLMSSQPTGKAWRLVESVVKLQQEEGQLSEMATNATVQLSSRSTTTSRILVVAIDDMVPMAEKFLAAHAQFQDNGKPLQVDIGYHWTATANLAKIQTDGLLTKAERDAKKIDAPYNGSSLGDGIYTASEPYTFYGSYGPTCLMVARLKGDMGPYCHAGGSASSIDTVVGSNGIVHVLKTSAQCIPLMYFQIDMIRPHDRSFQGNHLVYTYQVKLQDILDNALTNNRHSITECVTGLDEERVNCLKSTPVAKVLCASEANQHFIEVERTRIAALKHPPTVVATASRFASCAVTPSSTHRGKRRRSSI